MHTNRLTGILLVFLSLFCLTSCDDVNFPTFTFNENGVSEPTSLTPITSARFEEAVVGYGWKHVHTYEINPDGTCQTQDYYKDLDGAGPANPILCGKPLVPESIHVRGCLSCIGVPDL